MREKEKTNLRDKTFHIKLKTVDRNIANNSTGLRSSVVVFLFYFHIKRLSKNHFICKWKKIANQQPELVCVGVCVLTVQECIENVVVTSIQWAHFDKNHFPIKTVS